MSQMAKVFGAKWQEFSWRRGAILAVVLGLLIIVGVLPDDRRYFLSAIFGALFLALADAGGKHGPRVARMAIFAVAGALLTALGFGIGPGPWGWVVLAALERSSSTASSSNDRTRTRHRSHLKDLDPQVLTIAPRPVRAESSCFGAACRW